MVTRMDVVSRMEQVLKHSIKKALETPEYQEYKQMINTVGKGMVNFAFIKNAKKMGPEERSFMASNKISSIDKIIKISMGGMLAMADDANKDGKEFREEMDKQLFSFYEIIDGYFKHHPQLALELSRARDGKRKAGMALESDTTADTNILRPTRGILGDDREREDLRDTQAIK